MSRAALFLTMAPLMGCPSVGGNTTDTDSCDAYGIRPLESQSIAPGAASAWSFVAEAPVTKGGIVEVMLRITNTAEQDCPAAIYRGDDAPILEGTPVLDLSSAPPGTIDGLGRLVNDRIIPRNYEDPGLWAATVPLDLKPDQPQYVSIISGCSLESEGELSVIETCLEEISSSVVP